MATNLGTAWIQIKPSMQGMTSSIKSELSGLSSSASSMGTSSGRVFGDTFAVAAGTLISKGISMAIGKITSSFDTAIARVDTLKNANKVFEAMGYSSDAVVDSMKTLDSYLDGLPTSMTTAVGSVQSLSASFGGIEKGTQTFIDMNNAGLAFGATTEQIENAIMQLGQLSLDGPLDAQTWNSLRNSGFSPVFAAMAKEAGITVGELKEQFSAKGTKTVGDFLNELHKLSTEGGADMESLSSLARKNTDGIGTALENVQNRIGKAMAKVIDHIGSGKIAEAINNFSASFSGMADNINAAIDFLVEHWNVIGPILGTLGAFTAAIISINLALKAYQKIMTAVNAVQTLFGKVLGTVKKGVDGISTAVAKSPVGESGSKIGSFFSNIANAIKSAITSIGQILKSAAKAIVEPLKVLFEGLGKAFAGFFKAFSSPEIALGAAMFALAAASIAAAIFLIGSAIGAVMPALKDLFDNIIMPIAQFIADTVLNLIVALTDATIRLTNEALIPLGEFMINSFAVILKTITDMITGLTQGAIIPLINTLSGAFVSIIRTVGDIINSVLKTALEGIANITRAVGEGFEHMGNAIRSALEGATAVVNAFANLIEAISDAAVAIVAMATNHSINYGRGYAHLFAQGGRVEGPGTATSDSIPAFLSNGEYVIRASAAREIGYDTLDDLNASGRLGSGQTINFTINGYNKSPEELANIISRKIAFNQRGVIG